MTFLNKVDSLTYENGVYHLTLGQGEYGNMKADLRVFHWMVNGHLKKLYWNDTYKMVGK